MDAIGFSRCRKSIYLASKINADFIETAADMGKAIFVVLIIRQGKLTGKRSYTANLQFEEEMADVVERFVTEYYEDSDKLQQKLVVGERFGEVARTLAKYFESRGVSAAVPENDDERSLIRIAAENASLHLSQVVSKVDVSVSLGGLQDALGLDRLPMRIEGFDIANLLGEQAVASMVSFYAAKPDKKNYRHFKIRGKDTPDDFAM
jgi:excinuclease ABC subunit C